MKISDDDVVCPSCAVDTVGAMVPSTICAVVSLSLTLRECSLRASAQDCPMCSVYPQ